MDRSRGGSKCRRYHCHWHSRIHCWWVQRRWRVGAQHRLQQQTKEREHCICHSRSEWAHHTVLVACNRCAIYTNHPSPSHVHPQIRRFCTAAADCQINPRFAQSARRTLAVRKTVRLQGAALAFCCWAVPFETTIACHQVCSVRTR